jgi:hypothetical protein
MLETKFRTHIESLEKLKFLYILIFTFLESRRAQDDYPKNPSKSETLCDIS